MWHDRICVAFGYPSDGWVLLAVMTAAFNQHVVIHCSDVFQPFDDMLAWLHRVADRDLPATFSVDEEGVAKSLRVCQSPLGEDTVEFAIEGEWWKEHATAPEMRQFLRCRVDRWQLVAEFAQRFRRWLKEDYDPLGFGYRGEEARKDGYGFDLRDLDVEGLLRKLPNNTLQPTPASGRG